MVKRLAIPIALAAAVLLAAATAPAHRTARPTACSVESPRSLSAVCKR